jgi:hypothetical protein
MAATGTKSVDADVILGSAMSIRHEVDRRDGKRLRQRTSKPPSIGNQNAASPLQ